jgi:hypothetical protein
MAASGSAFDPCPANVRSKISALWASTLFVFAYALSIVYAVTIIVGAVGNWSYYILGSSIEVALLAAVVHYAWTWPKLPKMSERNSTRR